MTATMRSALFLAVTFALLSGCEAITTTSDYDCTVDYAQLRSFAWISDKPLVTSPPLASPLLERHIMNAVHDTMVAKGFRYEADPEQADITISFSVGARDKIRITSYPAPYAAGWGGWDGWGWGGCYNNVDVRQYTEGELTIDFFEVKAHRPIWQGRATKALTTSDRENTQAAVLNAVQKILAAYPPVVTK